MASNPFRPRSRWCAELAVVLTGWVLALALSWGQLQRSNQGAGSASVFAAIRSGDLPGVRELVKRRASLLQTDKVGFTPLTQSIEVKQQAIVLCLIEAGADVNKADGRGERPLVAAAHSGNIDIVSALLRGGASLNGRSRDGSSALSRSIEQGDIAMFTFLARKGANPNICAPHQWSPMHWVLGSVGASSKDLLTLLIKNHANLNAIDADGTHPMHLAVKDGIPIVEILLRAGADINCRTADSGRTPLHVAAVESISVTEYLLKHGAKVNLRSKDGRTPLDDVETSIAVQKKYKLPEDPNLSRIRTLLLRYGAVH